MNDHIWFYRDSSEGSAKVEEGLRRRGIPYRTITASDYGRPLPAIEAGASRFESLPDIELYFFALLDAGYQLEGLYSGRAPSAAVD
jgi:hypothetical protein